MNFFGKYSFTMRTPSGEKENKLFLRDYYDGSLHARYIPALGGVEAAKDISMAGNVLSFTAQAGPCEIDFTFDIAENGKFTGKAIVKQGDELIETNITGVKSEITPEDDGVDKIEMKGRALVMYATMTKNTEKVAQWFKETFEHYNMKATMIKVTNNMRWEDYGPLYLEDFDVICLGSPIIGGSPMKSILKYFSAGAASDLEDNVAKNAEAGLSFNAGGAGGFAAEDVRGGTGGGPGQGEPPPPMTIPTGNGLRYKPGTKTMQYPGGPRQLGLYQPIGITFTTYGGGFEGSEECLPVLALLKLYLQDRGCKVIGSFACCGKEFGPAGLDDGITPMQVNEPPVYYKDADGKYHAGGFFFHCHANSKPGPREEAKARAFIADIVEDHFYTNDGKRRIPGSEYISIS